MPLLSRSGPLGALERRVERLLYRVELLESAGPQVCRVRRTGSNVTIPNGTWVALSWDTKDFDTGGFWDSASPTHLTIPEQGHYQVGGAWSISSGDLSSDARLITMVRVNGTDYCSSGELHAFAGEFATVSMVSKILYLSKDDYIEILAYQNSGSSVTWVTGLLNYAWIRKL